MLPPGSEESGAVVHHNACKPIVRSLCMVGSAFEHHVVEEEVKLAGVEEEVKISVAPEEQVTLAVRLEGIPKDDLYGILCLDEKRWNATEEELKDAFQRLSLMFHPDKLGEGADDTLFKRIRQAYEELSDPILRQKYDSVDPTIDDTIPSKKKMEEDEFFEVYGACFRDNARWSQQQPVPELGNASTPYEEVEAFYDFWRKLQSWRDFSRACEKAEDVQITENDSRDDRRWKQKKIRAQKAKMKKEENSRIALLVKNAFMTDPRVRAAKAAEKERQRKEKEERERKEKEQQEAEEQQALAKAEAESQRQKQEEQERKVAQKTKQKKKKALSKARGRFRTLCTTPSRGEVEDDKEWPPTATDVEYLAQNLNREELLALATEVASLKPSTAAARVIVKKATALRKEEEEKKEVLFAKARALEAERQREKEEKQKAKLEAESASWTDEELRLLAKGVKKFPGGTRKRWECIQQIVPSKSIEAIIRRVSELRLTGEQKKIITGRSASEYFEDLKKVTVDAAKISSPLTQRYLDDEVGWAARKAKEEEEAKKKEAPRPWTADEQRLLEAGLKKFSAKDKERWVKIAEMVPGRSKKECIRRFKELAAAIKAKRAAKKKGK